MQEPGVFAWRNPWVRWSVVSLVGLTLASMAVGFIWLPSVQADFSAQGLWVSICRAAGVPGNWGSSPATPKAGATSTEVVLVHSMALDGRSLAGAGTRTSQRSASHLFRRKHDDSRGRQHPLVALLDDDDAEAARRSCDVDGIAGGAATAMATTALPQRSVCRVPGGFHRDCRPRLSLLLRSAMRVSLIWGMTHLRGWNTIFIRTQPADCDVRCMHETSPSSVGGPARFARPAAPEQFSHALQISAGKAH